MSFLLHGGSSKRLIFRTGLQVPMSSSSFNYYLSFKSNEKHIALYFLY